MKTLLEMTCKEIVDMLISQRYSVADISRESNIHKQIIWLISAGKTTKSSEVRLFQMRDVARTLSARDGWTLP